MQVLFQLLRVGKEKAPFDEHGLYAPLQGVVAAGGKADGAYARFFRHSADGPDFLEMQAVFQKFLGRDAYGDGHAVRSFPKKGTKHAHGKTAAVFQ